MKENFVKHTEEMLTIWKNTISTNPLLDKETGSVNAKGDRSIQMDVQVEKEFLDYLKGKNLPVRVFSEEVGTVDLHPNPEFLVAFDPLDGSTNYKVGKNLLPFGSLIAFYANIEPRLEEIVAAGAIEFTRDIAWIYDGEKTKTLDGKLTILRTDWELTKSTPIYLDLYYKEGYERYRNIAQQLFIRNTGSTIGNLSLTLSNVATGLGGVSMRAEEIGAVYALLKGAGGIAVNHNGDDLGKEMFHPEKTYPILGGVPSAVHFALDKLTSQ